MSKLYNTMKNQWNLHGDDGGHYASNFWWVYLSSDFYLIFSKNQSLKLNFVPATKHIIYLEPIGPKCDKCHAKLTLSIEVYDVTDSWLVNLHPMRILLLFCLN